LAFCENYNNDVEDIIMRFIYLALCIMFIACFLTQVQSQIDPLGTESMATPIDLRRASSLGAGFSERVILDPYLDPLSIESLMRPMNPEHTWDYLDKLSGGAYTYPYSRPTVNLAGNWRIELVDNNPKYANIVLLQNGEIIYGRGQMQVGSAALTAAASGMLLKDMLYLDILTLDDLTLYKCVFIIDRDSLSGNYYAFGSQGYVWSGRARGSKTFQTDSGGYAGEAFSNNF
jgi:hypothetical protein